MLFDLIEEGREAQFQDLRGLGAVAMRLLERSGDELPFQDL